MEHFPSQSLILPNLLWSVALQPVLLRVAGHCDWGSTNGVAIPSVPSPDWGRHFKDSSFRLSPIAVILMMVIGEDQYSNDEDRREYSAYGN